MRYSYLRGSIRARRLSNPGRLVFAGLTLALISACTRDIATSASDGSFHVNGGPKQGTFYGAAAKLGNGHARTYFTLEDGAVQEVGVALGEGALQGLPGASGHSHGKHSHANEYDLPMHPRNPTPIQFVGLNWNPEGHPPEILYGVPHFDFHFNLISLAERNTIVPTDPQWSQKAASFPDASRIPQGYLPSSALMGVSPAEATVPLMGLHWLDPASSELNGQPFTETFLYGTWDGKLIFAEPMITKAFLESKPNLVRELPTAQQGFTPSSYRVYWHEARKEYRIAFTGLPTQP